METGNVNAAIHIVTNNMGGGILPLNDETLIIQKHPEGREMNEDIVLQGPTTTVNPIVYGVIDIPWVLKAEQRTKGVGENLLLRECKETMEGIYVHR